MNPTIPRDLNEPVIVETMPDCWRASHRAARNFGRYPGNGTERSAVTLGEAREIIAADPDGYASIAIERPSPDQLAEYGWPRAHVIHYTDGRPDVTVDSYAAAIAIIALEYPQCEIGHDGDLSDGGDRTLAWSCGADAIDDDGARAIASIRLEARS